MARRSEDSEIAKARAKEMFMAGKKLVEIAEHPEVSRAVSLIHRWKEAGGWEDERAAKIAKKSGIANFIKPSTQKAIEEILDVNSVDLDSDEPLSDDEMRNILTIVVKTTFKQLLTDLQAGRVQFKNPTQLTNFMDMILKEFHLARGEPTEITEKRETYVLDPNDDANALKEGLSRLKQIADRRKDKLMLDD